VGDLLDLPIVDKMLPVTDPNGYQIGHIFLIRDREHPSVCRWKSVSFAGRDLGWAASRTGALDLFGTLLGD
jgi:hypothetical protein